MKGIAFKAYPSFTRRIAHHNLSSLIPHQEKPTIGLFVKSQGLKYSVQDQIFHHY